MLAHTSSCSWTKAGSETRNRRLKHLRRRRPGCILSPKLKPHDALGLAEGGVDEVKPKWRANDALPHKSNIQTTEEETGRVYVQYGKLSGLEGQDREQREADNEACRCCKIECTEDQ